MIDRFMDLEELYEDNFSYEEHKILNLEGPLFSTVGWNVMDIQGKLMLFGYFHNQTPIFN